MMIQLFRLRLYTNNCGYREGFDIGVFSTHQKAIEVKNRYLREIEGFKDYECEYEIITRNVIGEYDDDVEYVFQFQGWNTDENDDETDIYESECYVDENIAKSELERKKRTLIKEEWEINKCIIDKCYWEDGFFRISAETPTLETDRLILRPFKENDAEDVFECWESDPDVAKYMFWTSHNDIEKTKEWISFEIGQIEKDNWYRFALVLKETNELIGTALVYYEEEVQCWEVGYNLGKKYWGKGYATEAMSVVVEFAREKLMLFELVGRYAKENPASGRVMKKLGFEYEKDIPYECNDGSVVREGIQCRLVLY